MHVHKHTLEENPKLQLSLIGEVVVDSLFFMYFSIFMILSPWKLIQFRVGIFFFKKGSSWEFS